MYKPKALLLMATMATAVLLGACGRPPEPAAAHAATAGKVPDLAVSEQVQSALRQSESLKNFDIAVLTSKGDVLLRGTLDSQPQIDEAISIARAATGAHTVHNHLAIKP